MDIKENMHWPAVSGLTHIKMQEHAAWYTGSSEILANFYTEYMSKSYLNLPYILDSRELFWGRQIVNNGETCIHVPLAGDIAETSSNLIFAEAPRISLSDLNSISKSTFEQMETMLEEMDFNQKLLEAAENCAALGGIFIKIAWDKNLSPYPIPVVVQPDRAIPDFKFGIMQEVTFWKVVDEDDSNSKIYRLLETYTKGGIEYRLFLGSCDRLGKELPLEAHPDTMDLVNVNLGYNELLAIYIPNMRPNRLDRFSYLGRSDLDGIEGLMDGLDEVYSAWIQDIIFSKGKIHIPEQYMRKISGKNKFNHDIGMYVELDIDPTVEGDKITATQFAIRADEFEKTSLNLLERIVTAAGYSPQSFGLNIQGRAESGTALTLRERKSFATKAKKQTYWYSPIKKLLQMMLLVYNKELAGNVDPNVTVTMEFSDSITNDLGTISNSVKLISDAVAASVETKVRLLHPEWEEEQVMKEVEAIKKENLMNEVPSPDDISPFDGDGDGE